MKKTSTALDAQPGCPSCLIRIRVRPVHAGKRSLAMAAVITLATAGCALTPRGYPAERSSLEAAGASLAQVPRRDDLPVPASGNDWRTLLRRALVANGDVRAAWFEWKAAVERVPAAASWPNTNVSLGYSYLFSDERVKTFDRMTFSAGFDSMENLSFPGKAMAAGRVALADARAAGEKFRAAKFGVQRRVLDAWLDLALAAEQERIAAARTSLAAIGSDAARASLSGGGAQGNALTMQISATRREDDAASARSRVESARATLAALTASGRGAAVSVPTRLPDARALPADPGELVRAAALGPEAKGLEADRRARGEEQDLAELQWVPDINPYAMVTGSIEQAVGAAIVLPTTIVEIRSGIDAARAMRGAASARLVQSRRDRRADVAAALVVAANAERARRLLESRILPAAESVSAAAESSYSAGRGSLPEWLEARDLVLEARGEIAAAAIEREKQLAAIEEIVGADLETFTQPTPQATAALTPPSPEVLR